MRRRRGGIIPARCKVSGCKEDTFYEYATQAEYAEKKRLADAYLCLKHDKPSEWLRPEQPRIEAVVIATRLPGLPNDLFWVPEGGTTGSGFTHGPGFRAFADDVPEGTRLRVVATLELPPARKALSNEEDHGKPVPGA